MDTSTIVDVSTWDELEPLLAGARAVVEFRQDNCAECRVFDPIFHAVAGEREDLVFVRIDSPSSLDLVDRFTIRAAPTVLFLHDGQELERLVEPSRRDALDGALERLTTA